MAERPRLRALADRLGILASYLDSSGRRCRPSDATREALLAAMGVDASSEREAGAALRELDRRERAQLLAPVRVVFEGTRAARRVRVRPPEGASRNLQWRVEWLGDGGERDAAEGGARPRRDREDLSLPLPGLPTPGYHRLKVLLEGPGVCRKAEQTLVVAPARCVGVAEKIGEGSAFGIWCNLYSLRSRHNWGAGDLGDLRRLVEFAAGAGAVFVGTNPLHAIWNRELEVSPYYPVSRLFRSPLYLELEVIPELAECKSAGERVEPPGGAAELAALRGATQLDYARVMAAKRPVLQQLHRRFAARHRERPTERGRAYADYLAREGEPLDDFASFLALAEHFSRLDPTGRDWHRWPSAYRSPGSPAVARFRAENPEAIDFHRWVQFELDRQLGQAARSASEQQLAVGLYADLALGSAGSGSDAWSFPGLFAEGASVGAPPDEFATHGQDWAFPPLDPQRLRRQAYGYWIRLLRAAFAHTGALRIDHAMGLSRLYWIPTGRPATEGAYVRYPETDLLGILALESRRHGALVIAEDLGTVPRGLPSRLARRGVLSSRVLYFERENGSFRASRRYSPRALASANTHDLVPLAGFLSGRDLELRRRVGQIDSDRALEEARSERERELRALLRRLEAEGLLEPGAPRPAPAKFAAAVSAFLGRTPAPLVALSLDDLGGEEEPVNLPDVGPEHHPSWTRRMQLELEALAASPEARATLRAARR